MSSQKNPILLHPIMFAIYSVLFLYVHNLNQAHAADLLFPSSLVLSVVVVLWLGLGLLLKSYAKAALIVSAAVMLFFSYGHLYHFIHYWMIGNFKIGRHRFLLPLYFFAFLGILVFAIFKRKFPEGLSRFLNAMSVILVAVSIYNIAAYHVGRSGGQEAKAVAGAINLDVSEGRPDIYFILLDGHANSETVASLYGYDNSAFIDSLEALGFSVTQHAYSNYNQTNLSMPSILDMRYINFLAREVGEESIDVSIPWSLIRNGRVWQSLRKAGYNTYLVRNGWGPTDRNPYVTEAINCGGQNEFIRMMTHTTMLCIVEANFFVVEWHRENIRQMLQKLPKISEKAHPSFTYAHFLLPHPPYVFDEHGNPVEPQEVTLVGDIWTPRESYIAQMKFIDTQILKVIREIIDQSSTPPVIVLMGDHGPGSLDQWDNPSDEFIAETHRILHAVKLSRQEQFTTLDHITSVNTFRFLFNHLFQAGLDTLEDEIYHSRYESPYKFTDVTSRLLPENCESSDELNTQNITEKSE